MKRADLAPLAIGAALFFVLVLAFGPKPAVGAIVGAAVLAAIWFRPIIGLGFMILSGTALQVLGSEHLTGLPMSLGKLFGVTTFAVWVVRSLMTRTPVTYTPQLPWLLALVGAMALSMTVTPDRSLALDGLFRYAQLILLYFMIVNLAGLSGRSLDQAVLMFSLAMVASVFIGMAEMFLPSFAIEADDPALVQGTIGAILDRDSMDGVEIKRITGGLSDSNWFAYTLAGALPLNLYLFRRTSSQIARLFIVGLAALQLLGIILSLTRSGLFAVAVSVVVLVLKRRIPLAPILAVVAAYAVGFLAWSPAGIERLFSLQYLEEGSTPLRRYLLEGGVTLIWRRPIFGYGYSEFGPEFMRWLPSVPAPEAVTAWAQGIEQRVADGQDQLEWVMPHNTVLQMGVEYGLLGLGAAVMFIIAIFKDLSLVSRLGGEHESQLADCLIAATWGFLASAMFGNLAMLKVVWILAGFAGALRRVTLQARGPGRIDDLEPTSGVPIVGTA
jgi:O-antigen ligase